MRSYPSFINGRDAEQEEWVHVVRVSAMLTDPVGALTLKQELDQGAVSPDPDDDRLAGRVGVTALEQSEKALEAARRAQPEWASVPLEDRCAFAVAVHEAVRKAADQFVDMLVLEGHPRTLAQWEVTGIIHGTNPETVQVNMEMMHQVRHSKDGRENHLVGKPHGVVCINPPQNAAASNSLMSVGALAAGNAVVVKAPRAVPLATVWAHRELVAPLLDKFGAPPGTLNVVCGHSEPLIKQWLNSPHADSIFFFGSSERGKALELECTKLGKTPILELAGNDGVLVWEDADAELAAQAVAECFYGSAQICMVPKYVIAHPNIADRLIAEVLKIISEFRPGLPENDDVLLSPVLKSQPFFDVLSSALNDGATLLTGGERIDLDGTPSSDGLFLAPTLLRVDSLSLAERMEAVREETFFPLLPIVVPRSNGNRDALLQDCLDFMERNPYGLRNSLWTNEVSKNVIDSFCRLSNGGILKVNDSHVGFVPGLPTHGGTGLTGGVYGEANFPMLRTTRLQAISIATGVQPPARVFDHAAVMKG